MSLVDELQKIETCAHENVRPTRATKSNGVVCVYIQCRQCGVKVREVSKKDYNVNILPAFDDNLRRHHQEQRQKQRSEIVDQYRANENAEFWNSYSTYLRSEHWRRLRISVIRRDNYECQNCFDAISEASAHVHHMSYTGFQRLGYSFAFECVTLCRECHDAFHGGLDRQR